jgi:trehalose 6-phosphate synthase
MERLRQMREVVRSRNVYRWAGQMLVDAAHLRRRQRLVKLSAEGRLTPRPPRRSILQLLRLK